MTPRFHAHTCPWCGPWLCAWPGAGEDCREPEVCHECRHADLPDGNSRLERARRGRPETWLLAAVVAAGVAFTLIVWRAL